MLQLGVSRLVALEVSFTIVIFYNTGHYVPEKLRLDKVDKHCLGLEFDLSSNKAPYLQNLFLV